MHLDDETRSRLRALADATRTDLDEPARDRVARSVASQGPRVMRRARIQRASMQIAGVCALIAALSYRLLTPSAAPMAHEEPRAQPPSSVQAPAPAAAVARACEQREASEPQWRFAGGRAHVDLGVTGTLAVDDGAQLWVDASERCSTRVRLLGGRVRVHAADLGGGELRVVTPSGDVVVHGTTFGVAQDASGLTVEVDEGRVGVRTRGSARAHMIGAGQRLRAATGGEALVEALPASDRDALRAALRDDAPTPTPAHADRPVRVAPRVPAPTAVELVAEADAMWQRGERDHARERYRQAGALSGPTAEAAWLALARRELSVHAPAAANQALQQYSAHFAHGMLAAEADGIAFRTAVELNDLAEARRVAQRLVATAPGTAQADAAKRWLETHK
jgi:hypothetical protein